MNISDIEEELIKDFEGFEIIDAHEHLPPERVRVEQKVDALTLFMTYTKRDLITAGLPPKEYDMRGKNGWDINLIIEDVDMPLEKRWGIFSPYLKYIKYGSYARPAFMAAKEFYGFDDINDDNYKALSERMVADNKPGIYDRILRKKCNIRTALTQAERTDYDLDLLVPLMPSDAYAGVRSGTVIEEKANGLGEEAEALDDYVQVIRKGLERWKSEGVVGLKIISRPYGKPDRGKAVSLFDDLMRDDKKILPGLNPLRSYLMEEMLDMASELDLVVAVHTGMWGDFRIHDPMQMIPIIMRHPNTKFDLYHMGMPWVRETGVIGKNFPNVWLNLCWSHIISPRMTCSALDEWIDMVPINKIIAFGGDYDVAVEKVYGHLVIARENIAKVLAGRIEDGLMSEGEATSIAEKWFYHNPKELYQLKP